MAKFTRLRTTMRKIDTETLPMPITFTERLRTRLKEFAWSYHSRCQRHSRHAGIIQLISSLNARWLATVLTGAARKRNKQIEIPVQVVVVHYIRFGVASFRLTLLLYANTYICSIVFAM